MTAMPSSNDQVVPPFEVEGVLTVYVEDRESFVHESRAKTAIKSCIAKTLPGVLEDSVNIRGFSRSSGRSLQQVPHSSLQLVDVDFAIVLQDGSAGRAQEVAGQLQHTKPETLSTQLSKELATVGLQNSIQVTGLTSTTVLRATPLPIPVQASGVQFDTTPALGNLRHHQTTQAPRGTNAYNIQAIGTASTTPQAPTGFQSKPKLDLPAGSHKQGDQKPCKTNEQLQKGGEGDEAKNSRGKHKEAKSGKGQTSGKNGK